MLVGRFAVLYSDTNTVYEEVRPERQASDMKSTLSMIPGCKHTTIPLILVGCQLCPLLSLASDFSGVATLTSEYIYRGLGMSAGDPAIQLGVDYEHDSGFFLGAWATTIELNSSTGQRDVELDYYAGYLYSSQAPLTASLTVLRYTYPGQSAVRSYDYNEVLVGATWRERYSVEIGYTSDLYGFGRIARHWELRSEWPVANAWVISAALGGNDMSDAGASRFLHWDIGVSARYSRLTFDVRWYDSEQAEGFASTYSADSRFVLSISAAF